MNNNQQYSEVIPIACNWELLNRVDYSRPKVIKNILYHYDDLMAGVMKGDQVAAIVCIDVKRAIHTRGVLTFKQRRYLSLWWQGHSFVNVADIYNMSPVAVKLTIDLAFRNISVFLCRKYSFCPQSVPKYRGIKNGG